MKEQSGLVDLIDYNTNGFVVLRGALEPSVCESAEKEIWVLLNKLHGIRSSDTSTWTIEDPRGLSALRGCGAFELTAPDLVMQAIEEILGERPWGRPDKWGGPLVTFPRIGPWKVPNKGWHIDYPARGNLGLRFGVKMLGLLKDMESGGGATLLSPGSHQVVHELTLEKRDGNAGNSSKVRKTLDARGHDFRNEYFEFTGSAGDVLLFDPWLFHAASPNTRKTPRMMVEQNVPSIAALSLYAG